MPETPHPRPYKNAEWLRDQAIEQGKNSREISREQSVSYKLIELYLREFDIPFTSMVPKKNED